jgi:hypothetical protein
MLPGLYDTISHGRDEPMTISSIGQEVTGMWFSRRKPRISVPLRRSSLDPSVIRHTGTPMRGIWWPTVRRAEETDAKSRE